MSRVVDVAHRNFHVSVTAVVDVVFVVVSGDGRVMGAVAVAVAMTHSTHSNSSSSSVVTTCPSES